jgi:periplasmic iron binding protein
MYQRWIGPIMVLLILGGVASVLVLNLNLKGTQPRAADSRERAPDADSPQPAQAPTAAPSTRRPAGFREYPIGDDVERNQMRIAAVWLPPVQMEGMSGPASSDLIHIEADIHATEGNKNGCPKDEFIPYLTVHYSIVPESGAAKSVEPIRGKLMPMVARDGWHYGASVPMPKAGRYKLTYTIEPPSAAEPPCAAGRHSDAVTGVDPWWNPFEVSFDWDYPGPPS